MAEVSEPLLRPTTDNVPEFAYRFVSAMRTTPDLQSKPTVRQTQAIAGLLSARFFRNGKLSLDDFIGAAVFTTNPVDQETARAVAEEVLFGRKNTTQEQKPEPEKVDSRGDRKNPLHSVLETIRRERELAECIAADRAEAGYDFLTRLRQNADDPVYRAVRAYLNEGDIILRGLTNHQELLEEVRRELMNRTGSLTAADIRNAQTLDALDTVCESGSAAERTAARALRGDADLQEQFAQLARGDPATAAKALRLVEELASMSHEDLEAMRTALEESLQNLSDLASYAAELHRLPADIHRTLESSWKQYDLSDAAELARSISRATGQDITERLLEQYDLNFEQARDKRVDMSQLAQTAMNCSSWRSLLSKETRRLLQEAAVRSSPTQFLTRALSAMAQDTEQVDKKDMTEQWEQAMCQLADAAVSYTQSKSQLRQTVRHLSGKGVTASNTAIEAAGRRLGLSETEIAELLNPSFQVVKSLVQQGVRDFERLYDLMTQSSLSGAQLNEIASIALQTDNRAALGAVAHLDLRAALGLTRTGRSEQSLSPLDPSRVEKVLDGILGGPATNIVKMWYTYREELPAHIRVRLREIARRMLLDLGRQHARSTVGSSMLGGVQESTTVRPFRIGDEPDLISLEETLEALLSQGRHSFEVIDPEDLLVTETCQGHRAFFWALDKSGSMDQPEKLGMLSVSVMAGLFAVQRDDFGVVLFDHMTHVVKTVRERHVSVEKVVSDLLDIRAGGGTGGANSMRLALENLEESRAKDKFFVFASDMYLSDTAQCVELARRMRLQGIRMIVLVPRQEKAWAEAEEIARAAHGVVVDIASVDELPHKLLTAMDHYY
ncbi:MAG: hypothetical protein HXY34_13785 [Candidatus Thorarchaeota archaeon]|nr:hypothetical protein [Candidatus Thorarchaeota archaeon]